MLPLDQKVNLFALKLRASAESINKANNKVPNGFVLDDAIITEHIARQLILIQSDLNQLLSHPYEIASFFNKYSKARTFRFSEEGGSEPFCTSSHGLLLFSEALLQVGRDARYEDINLKESLVERINNQLNCSQLTQQFDDSINLFVTMIESVEEIKLVQSRDDFSKLIQKELMN